MTLSQAERLLFKPSTSTSEELQAVQKLPRQFCPAFYAHVYAGKLQRLRLCRPTVVALLDVAANLRSCGPAWCYLQFPTERVIGSLTRLLRSRRFPNAALTTAVSAKYSAELVHSFAETHAADAWAEATRRPTGQYNRNPAGTFQVSEHPHFYLLAPRRPAEDRIGHELSRMKNVLVLEGATRIPDRIIVKMYCRKRLVRGQSAGPASSGVDAGDGRRDFLVRVCSLARQAARRGSGAQEVLVNVYGSVHHDAVVLIDGETQAFAHLECIKSSEDRHGASGLPETRRDTDYFRNLGGAIRCVSVKVIDAAVGTLFVRGKHVVLYTSEVFRSEYATGKYFNIDLVPRFTEKGEAQRIIEPGLCGGRSAERGPGWGVDRD